MKIIGFKEFQELDLRIGTVIEAERVEGSRNLIKLEVNFGVEKRQAVAGLAQQYRPEELVGNKYVFICNLEPKTLMGIESECMIFAAEDNKGNIVLLRPERDIDAGSKVR